MKKYSLLTLVSCMVTTSVFAGELIGPPTSIKKGATTAELELTQYKLDTNRLVSWVRERPSNQKLVIDSSDQNVKVSYGLIDNVAVFVLGGASKADQKQYGQNGLSIDTSSESNEKWGFGANVKAYDDGKLAVGGAISWTTFDHKQDGINREDTGTLYTKLDRLKVSLNVSYLVDARVRIYGGPVFQQISGDNYWIWDDEGGISNRQGIEQDRNYGAFLGAEFQIAPNMTLKGEVQNFGGSSEFLGASFSYLF
jgi:hypothetical protein